MAPYFKSDEFNFDSKQSLIMENKKTNLIKSNKYINSNNINNNNINNNNLDSINEAKDYLGCIGNNCTKIENNEVNNFQNPANSNKQKNNSSNDYNK